MSINDWSARFKAHELELFITVSIILTGLLGFGLGRWSYRESNRRPVRIENVDNNTIMMLNQVTGTGAGDRQTDQAVAGSGPGGAFVASRNGQRYYPKDCPAANRIKEENKIWFADAHAAETAGYTRAGNCP